MNDTTVHQENQENDYTTLRDGSDGDQSDSPPDAEDVTVAEPGDMDTQLTLRVEAALMSTDRALASAKLAQLLGQTTVKEVNAAVHGLNQVYADSGRSFRIEAVAGGWQIHTLPQFAPILQSLHKTRQIMKLSPAALETLAIIAYKQPILRADVEAIRGVACGEIIRSLMDRRLIKITGRADEIGRPMLYGTTKNFLEVFGLADLKDLPKIEDLCSRL